MRPLTLAFGAGTMGLQTCFGVAGVTETQAEVGRVVLFHS